MPSSWPIKFSSPPGGGESLSQIQRKGTLMDAYRISQNEIYLNMKFSLGDIFSLKIYLLVFFLSHPQQVMIYTLLFLSPSSRITAKLCGLSSKLSNTSQPRQRDEDGWRKFGPTQNFKNDLNSISSDNIKKWQSFPTSTPYKMKLNIRTSVYRYLWHYQCADDVHKWRLNWNEDKNLDPRVSHDLKLPNRTESSKARYKAQLKYLQFKEKMFDLTGVVIKNCVDANITFN